MKLWTLMENTACSADFYAEHGLSLYLQTGDHKILFDAGQSEAFSDNAQKLGIDLNCVDMAILSHGHYDHSGGLTHFLACNDHAPIYLSSHAFEGHFNARGSDIGVSKQLEGNPRLRFVEEEQNIVPGLTLFTCNHQQLKWPIEPYGLSMEQDHRRLPEDFRHEQYLLVQEGETRILISGCSHKGILNLVQWFRPDILIGGFHFMKLDPDVEADRKTLTEAAQTLLTYPTVYYTGHCTGEKQFEFLKEIMGDRLQKLTTGQYLCLGECE